VLGDTPHGQLGLAPDQGVVVYEDVGLPQPLDGSDLILERPVGARGFQRITAEDEEHDDRRWKSPNPAGHPGTPRCRGSRPNPKERMVLTYRS
jgi:hypothetical protein